MKEARAALRYAKAVLNLAISQNSEAEVNDNMKTIVATIADSNELALMLKSPIIKASEKSKVLEVLFKDSNAITKGLFNLLKENKRIEMLATVASKYNVIYETYRGSKVAKVITTVPITKELEDKIQHKVVALTGKEATIENIVDPSILGGFILQVGDKQFDASVATKFGNLRREFGNKHYQAKV